MPTESLVYDIRLGIGSLASDAKNLEGIMDKVHDATDFTAAQMQIGAFASKMSAAAAQIQKSFDHLDANVLKDLTSSLQGLNNSVQTISRNMVTYMQSIQTSMESVNNDRFDKVSSELKSLQDSITKFGTVASGSLADAFKVEGMDKASEALKNYVSSLKKISELNLSRMTVNMQNINLANVVKQVNDFADAFDKLRSIDRRVDSLKKALDELQTLVPQDGKGSLNEIANAMDNIANKATRVSEAINGQTLERAFGAVDVKHFTAAMESMSSQIDQFVQKRRQMYEDSDSKNKGALSDYTNVFTSLISSINSVRTAVVNLRTELSKIATDMTSSLTNAINALNTTNLDNVADKAKNVGEGAKVSVEAVSSTIQQMVTEAKSGIEEIFNVLNSNREVGKADTKLGQLSTLITEISKNGQSAAKIIEKIGKVELNADKVQGFQAVVEALKQMARSTNSIVSAVSKIKIDENTVNSANSYAEALKLANKAMTDQLAAIRSKDGKSSSIIDGAKLDDIAKRVEELKVALTAAGNAMTQVFGGSTMNGLTSSKKHIVSISEVLQNLVTSLNTLSGGGEKGIDSLIKKLGDVQPAVDGAKKAFAEFGDYSAAFNPLKEMMTSLASNAGYLSRDMAKAKTAFEGGWNANTFGTLDTKIQSVTGNVSSLTDKIDALKTALSGIDTSALKSASNAAGKLPTTPTSGVVSLSADSIRSLTNIIEQSSTSFKTFNANVESTSQHIGVIAQSASVLQTVLTDIAVKTGTAGSTVGDILANMAQRVGEASQDVATNLRANIEQPVEQVVNVASASMDKFIQKFDGLSAASIKKSNGFFTGFGSAGDMKEFAQNLQNFVRIDTSTITNLTNALNGLTNIGNNGSDQGFANLNTTLTGLGTTITNLRDAVNDLRTALGGLNTNVVDNASIQQSAQSLQNILQVINDINTAMGQLGHGRGNGGGGGNNNQNIQDLGTEIARVGEIATRVSQNATQAVYTGWNAQGERVREVWNEAGQVIQRTTTEIENAQSAEAAANAAAAQAERQRVQQIRAATQALRQWQSLNRQAVGMDRQSEEFAELQNQIAAARNAYMAFPDAIRQSVELQRVYNQEIDRTRVLAAGVNDTQNNAAQRQADAEATRQMNAQIREAIAALREWQSANREMVGMNRNSAEFQALAENAARARTEFLSYTDAVRQSARVQQEYERQITKTRDAANKTNGQNSDQERINRQNQLNQLLEKQWDYEKRILEQKNKLGGAASDSARAAIQAEINRLLGEQSNVTAQINGLDKTGLDVNTKKAEIDEKRARLLADIAGKQKDVNNAQQTGVNLSEKMANQVMMMLRSYIGIMGLRRLWSSAKSYATEYYDAMNEIRIVTGMSAQDADMLGEKYRQMASEMSASSTDISKAAITYFRQGLSESDVDERLIATTQYAKVAGIEFDIAADIITSSVNTMGISAEHASDVFIKLGNGAGSSAEEIGTAMQKASASAQAAGLSFEWLGAYIATVSENTRQSAESIGTAMSTIMSRLHTIRAKGFNEEDETKVNDIAKALSNIGVSLFDVEGEWRSVSDIFNDISMQWGNLDAKTKAYIATTMAGTRQQNYFLSLMQDMAKQTEGASRAIELYNEAMEAAGTTAASYAIYEESVAAAQGRFNAAIEQFYSMLSGDFLKGIYDAFTAIITRINEATAATGGLNLAIPAVAAGLMLVIGVAQKVGAALVAAFSTNPYMVAIGGVIALGTVLINVFARTKTSVSEYEKAGESARQAMERLTKTTEGLKANRKSFNQLSQDATNLKSRYIELTSKTSLTVEEQAELEQVISDLVGLFPDLDGVINTVSGTYGDAYETIKAVNDELERQYRISQRTARSEASGAIDDLVQAYTGYSTQLQISSAAKEFSDEVNAAWGEYYTRGYKNAAGVMGNNNVTMNRLYTQGKDGKVHMLKQEDYTGDWGALVDSMVQDRMSFILNYLMNKASAGHQYFDGGMLIDYATNTLGLNTDGFGDGSMYDFGLKFAEQVYNLRDNISEAEDGIAGVKAQAIELLNAWTDDYGLNDSLKQMGEMYTQTIFDSIDLSNSQSFKKATDSIATYYEGLQDLQEAINLDFVGLGQEFNAINDAAMRFKQTGLRSAYDEYAELLEQWNTDHADHMLQNIFPNVETMVKSYVDAAKNAISKYKTQSDLGSFITDFFTNGYYIKEGIENEFELVKLSSEDAMNYILGLWKDAGGDISKFIELDGQNWSLIPDDIKSEQQALELLIRTYLNLAQAQSAASGGTSGGASVDGSSGDSYALAARRRVDVKNAQQSGFSSQVSGVKEAYSTGGMNAVYAYFNAMKESNNELYEAFIDSQEEYGNWVAQLLSGGDITEGSIFGENGYLSQYEKTIDTVAQRWKDFYAEVADITSSSEDGGITSMTDDAISMATALSEILNSVNQESSAAVKIESVRDMLEELKSTMNDEAWSQFISDNPILSMLFGDGAIGTGEGTDDQWALIEDWLNNNGLGGTEFWDNLLSSWEGLSEKSLDLTQNVQLLKDLMDGLTAEGGYENFMSKWGDLTDTQKDKIIKLTGMTEKAFNEMIADGKNATKVIKTLSKAMSKIELDELEDSGKIIKGTASAFENAGKNAVAFQSDSASLIGTAEKLVAAWNNYNTVLNAADKETEDYKSALSDLASATGYSSELLSGDLSYALNWLTANTDQAEMSIASLCNALLTLDGGTFDPSSYTGGLLALGADAGVAEQDLVSLINTLLQLTGASVRWVQDGSVTLPDGTVLPHYRAQVNGAGGNGKGGKGGSGGSGGGGGGGGGSGSGKDGKTAEQLFVERTEESIDRIGDRLKQLNTISNSWDSQGFFTAEIGAIEEANGLLEEQNEIYRAKIAEAQGMLPGLYAELNGLTPNTAEYDKVLERIKYIQDGITDWTQALTENEAEIVSNTQKIKDLQDQIRQLEIDLENEVLQAIEDREERERKMLESRIELENEIIEILKKQAETERDEIIKAIDAQIEALEREKDAIQELLDMRKQEAEQEDKVAELQKKEAQYARIVADPTRAKEAKALMEEIQNLRDEIAWDQAENESEAQQKSIDQQITSLEDYKEYIEQYYEDLLNNPQNFIEEVNRILQMSSADILAWLQQNSDDYNASTAATQEQMTASWQDTLDGMQGIVRTHWDEVAEIIAQGDEYVINFLKENSSKYREASQLQQQAYVDGWQKMFDDIAKAYDVMATHIMDNSSFVSTVTSGVGDNGGGGGGGGKPSGSSKPKEQYWTAWVAGTYSTGAVSNHKAKSTKSKQDAIDQAKGKFTNTGMIVSYETKQAGSVTKEEYDAFKVFKKGGLANFTGPAWLDGTKTNPERVLNPMQTKLFESLVASLQQMARVSVAPMTSIGRADYAGDGATGYNFGDINIHVDSLDSDADYDELAERVKESIVESMNHGRVNGGLTLR